VKKVLIISYFFPPSNFAGSYRIASWAKYLHLFGYYPVIITRCWNPNQSELTEFVNDNTFSHEKYDNYEVYRIPYQRILRDRVYSGGSSLTRKLASKVLTILELIFQNYSNLAIPYSNLYRFADKLLYNNKDFSALIVSGRPYQLFRFAWLLHNKHGIKWIADYRDPWFTNEIYREYNTVLKLINYIDGKSEKKWLKNASFFTTCSEIWVKSISDFTGKKGFNILNGYDPEDYIVEVEEPKNKNSFVIVYNGTLYFTQPINEFTEALKFIIDKYKDSINIKIKFPGITIDMIQTERLKKALKGYESYFEITDRLSKSEVIKIQKGADLLLMFSHKDVVGNFSSKIFEYLACERPILLCPSDNDVLEQLIKTTHTGYICSTKEETIKLLNDLVLEKLNTGVIAYNPVTSEVEKYTRKLQTKYLAAVLDKIC
jgi:hypothetical protein